MLPCFSVIIDVEKAKIKHIINYKLYRCTSQWNIRRQMHSLDKRKRNQNSSILPTEE